LVGPASVANQRSTEGEGPGGGTVALLATDGGPQTAAIVTKVMNGCLVRGATRVFMPRPSSAPRVNVLGEPLPPEGEDQPRLALPHLLGYTGRLTAACTVGQPATAVAVYRADEAVWCDPGGEDGERARTTRGSVEGLVRLLASVMVPCDLLGHDALLGATIEDEVLVVGRAAYDLVIVPQTEALLIGAAAKLLAFREAGGRLAFIGGETPAIIERDALRPLEDAFAGLLAGAYDVDLPRGMESLGGAFGWPHTDTRLAVMDGLAAGYLGGGTWLVRFAGAQLQPGVVLTVPPVGLGPFAQLLGQTYRSAPVQTEADPPTVRCLVRHLLDGAAATLLVNEGPKPADVSLGIVSETPLVLQRWDPMTGEGQQLLVHHYAAEAEQMRFRMAAGETALLISSPMRWTGRRA